MYKTNRIGPKTLPCGIPLVIFAHSEFVPFTLTCCTRSDKNTWIHLSVYYSMPYDLSLSINLL